jgi:alcohol dehydrogenase (cytochrome c)
MRLIKIDAQSGETVFDVSLKAPEDNANAGDRFSAGPLAVNGDIIVSTSGGATRNWIGAFGAQDGKLKWRFYVIPGPGEAGHETWKDDHNAYLTGGGGIWTTGSYDPENSLLYFGTGEPSPWGDPEFRPGDNLFTIAVVALNAGTGKLAWYFQEVPNETWDYDTVSPRMLYDVVIDGQRRKVQGNFARNGFYYTIDRTTGSFIHAKAYTAVNWTAGIDPKTGKPVEYDPKVAVQTYANKSSLRAGRPETSQNVCPYFYGAPTYFPPTYDARRQMAWAVASNGCFSQTLTQPIDQKKDWRRSTQFGGGAGLWTWALDGAQNGRIIGVNVLTGEKVQELTVPYVIYSGLLGTAGDLIFTAHQDGKFAAYDKDTLTELWAFNTGSTMSAPPISYSVDGKQYIAVVAGGQPTNQQLFAAPDLALVRQNAQVIVFGL